MKYLSSELDCFYNLRFDCATHYARIDDPQGMTRPHHHDDYEIYFLMSGNRKYFVYNTIYTLVPNQVAIFKPNVPHQVTVNLNIPYERNLVYLTPQLFDRIVKENPPLKSIADHQLFNLSEENFKHALEFISKINDEFKHNDVYSPDIIKNLAAQLLMFIGRHNDVSNVTIDKMDLRIQNAIDFILKEYSEPILLSDCAKTACMSPSHFSKSFYKTTGIGFNEFLNRTRINKALELLENTTFSISRIAQMVGFSTESHFCYNFRNLNGISPSSYRTLKKNKP